MKIEKENLQFHPFQLTPQEQGGLVTLSGRKDSFRLTPLQYSYLDVLKNGLSIEGLVQFFLGQGWLVNFRELYALIQFLVTERVIRNPAVIDYFKKALSDDAPMIFSSLSAMTGIAATQVNPAELPFFRSLELNLAKYLLKGAERFQVPAQIRLTHAGQTDRDLYILLKGQAAIYKVIDQHRRQMVATLNEGSLFGERGFLLNQPRNADVITTAPSEVLRVRHLPEFDQLIKTDKAQSLQHRFWVMQALLSSDIFKELPTDTLDALVFAGRLVQAPANQVLFQEGQRGNTCYILIQGAAVVSKQGRAINVMNQGSCFGEISLLVSGGVRTASVITQRDSVLLEIQQNDFYKMLSQNLILAKEIETLAAARLQKDATRK
ncbi:cyclic nucleotide-binding domain-containing protein [Bdellovibrio svalbardensis]|uniref:Cyclic nucleotide-binding domain-containing protein n=1 Tax=Bdellovibrio svalbardensis TaxID=2972972 RepID=A0ABT6DM08_9BACT|nr:cyclic nucleotide-binding domain-containing protein [Bdellovibrio svalbardensis]MDG0817532.1 cyclic nucleotide-binding domain-containing protein [Bdellovibrio svalbardensis]